ncbi:4-formylbenzenesulfonate dehydrogenase TsaC1/TsaC2 [Fonsecaea pedrosoi]|nr:4-formylbenzenesulfonate dehydrogenase TsaC1/TsaC2 [Fonsecaea pedrosoi]
MASPTLHQRQRLSDKVVIITGGGSGYGAGIAVRFADEGAKVAITDIDVARGEALAASSEGKIHFYQQNVGNIQDWQRVITAVETELGEIDCLINNAGTTYVNKPTLEVTEDDFDRCFDVNVKGIFHGTRTVIPHMLNRNQRTSIINIASVGATRPRPGLVWYNSSKAAVCNATKGLAAEFGPHGIRVNSADTPENRAKFIGNVPLGRLCEPLDVANACLFLASDESAFITGVNLEVDGGRAI